MQKHLICANLELQALFFIPLPVYAVLSSLFLAAFLPRRLVEEEEEKEREGEAREKTFSRLPSPRKLIP